MLFRNIFGTDGKLNAISIWTHTSARSLGKYCCLPNKIKHQPKIKKKTNHSRMIVTCSFHFVRMSVNELFNFPPGGPMGPPIRGPFCIPVEGRRVRPARAGGTAGRRGLAVRRGPPVCFSFVSELILDQNLIYFDILVSFFVIVSPGPPRGVRGGGALPGSFLNGYPRVNQIPATVA